MILLRRRIVRNKKFTNQKSQKLIDKNTQSINQSMHIQNNLLIERKKEKKEIFARYISEILSQNHVLNLRTFVAELDASDIILNFDSDKGFLFESLDSDYQIEATDLSPHDQSILEDYENQYENNKQFRR